MKGTRENKVCEKKGLGLMGHLGLSEYQQISNYTLLSSNFLCFSPALSGILTSQLPHHSKVSFFPAKATQLPILHMSTAEKP